jgi:two-component system, NarL family, nitrate/nitrite response regulator NarL
MPAESKKPIRIVLLNNQTLVRCGLKLLIESQPDFKVVGEAGERNEALGLVSKEQPDVILLELNLAGAIDTDIILELNGVTTHSTILLISDECSTEYYIQAVQKGVVGLVNKQQQPAVLFKAIEKIHAGEIWLDRSLVASALSQMHRGRPSMPVDPEARKISLISCREREIISGIGEGLKNNQIAERLFISEVTVRHHLTSIFKKLGVSDRLELIIYAYRNGLAQPPD